MTITEFLLARISEDEAVALKASEQIGQRWCGGRGRTRRCRGRSSMAC